MFCSVGKVQLDRLKHLPEFFYCLVNDLHPDHKHFMGNIRKYNAYFQMTSFGGKHITADGFSPTFKVKEQVYHLIGNILLEVLNPDMAHSTFKYILSVKMIEKQIFGGITISVKRTHIGAKFGR